MSSLRNFALILFLAGAGWAAYVSINKSPKPSPRLDAAPPWNPPQVSVQTPSGVLPAASSPGVGLTPSSPAPSPAAPSSTTALPAAPVFAPFSGPTPAPSAPSPSPASPYPSAAPPMAFATPPATPGTPSGAAPAPPTIVTPVSPSAPTISLPPVAAAPSPPSPATPNAQPPAPVAPPSSPTGNDSAPLAATMQAVGPKLAAGQLDDALIALSKLYLDRAAMASLSADQQRQLIEMLDQLAGTVIYSREHLLEGPYKVKPGDTLAAIGNAYNVPAELLSKINGIRDPSQVQPGMELKVVRGPFEAVVDSAKYEMTLFVQNRYAGRFPIGLGQDQPGLNGTFTVQDKKVNPLYRGMDRVFTGEDPSNPLGRRMLDLGSRVGIHGTDNPRAIGRTEGQGTIRLGDRDIGDVYDILSVGSRVTILR